MRGCPQAPVAGQIINTEKSNATEHTVCKFSATCSAFKCLLEAFLGKGPGRPGVVWCTTSVLTEWTLVFLEN